MTRLGVTLLVLVLVAAPAGSAAHRGTPTLHGTVGPGFNITLRDNDGKTVDNVALAGAYTIEINDLSDLHNFHLTGPGVDKFTDVGEMGQVIWDVVFVNGTYRFVCDAHVATMKGSFTVGPVTAPPKPTTPQKLGASVGPGAKIAFGRSAKAGKTTITVRDRSAADNFHLIGPGVNKKTGVRFKGTVTWSVTLRAGNYTFRSDAHTKLRGTTKVAS
jgi:hypothetical protein